MPILHQPSELILLLVIMSLLPLLVVMGTSFLKISVVFALVRNALGIQQIPPNIALYSLSLVLTLFIMAPVGNEVQIKLQAASNDDEAGLIQRLTGHNVLEPYKRFLIQHTAPKEVTYFKALALKSWSPDMRQKISDNSLLLLMPAFAISQLMEAFKIGLLLFLPFIAIDLIISNILLAMGMMMVSPNTISMPFKILIFVLVGGWQHLIDRLILTYQ